MELATFPLFGRSCLSLKPLAGAAAAAATAGVGSNKAGLTRFLVWITSSMCTQTKPSFEDNHSRGEKTLHNSLLASSLSTGEAISTMTECSTGCKCSVL